MDSRSRAAWVPTEEQKEVFLQAIISGSNVTEACKKIGVSDWTLYTYSNKDPIFDKDVSAARVEYAKRQVDNLIRITDDVDSMIGVGNARIKSENIKWMASKRIPHIYGDTLNINANVHLDLGETLKAANNRLVSLKDLNSLPSMQLDQTSNMLSASAPQITNQVSAGYIDNNADSEPLEHIAEIVNRVHESRVVNENAAYQSLESEINTVTDLSTSLSNSKELNVELEPVSKIEDLY